MMILISLSFCFLALLSCGLMDGWIKLGHDVMMSCHSWWWLEGSELISRDHHIRTHHTRHVRSHDHGRTRDRRLGHKQSGDGICDDVGHSHGHWSRSDGRFGGRWPWQQPHVHHEVPIQQLQIRTRLHSGGDPRSKRRPTQPKQSIWAFWG